MIHNTFLNKIFNELIETNALNPAYLSIGNQGVATILLEPYLDVVRSSEQIGGNGTMYTCPSDKDFYLKTINMNCYGDSVPTQGSATIQFITRDGQTIIHQIATSADGVGNAGAQFVFPNRGVLLQKGSAITSSIVNGIITISGYTGSSRSF